MVHIGQRYDSRLVYDPSYPKIDHSDFKKCDWLLFYMDTKEIILMNTPEPVVICMFVDSVDVED